MKKPLANLVSGFRFSWFGFNRPPPSASSVPASDYSDLGTDNGGSDLSPTGDLKFREFRRIADSPGTSGNSRVNKWRPNNNDSTTSIPTNVMTKNSYFHNKLPVAAAADTSARHYFVSNSESRAGLTEEQS